MLNSFIAAVRVVVLMVMSSILILPATPSRAHEVLPAIADMTRDGNVLTFKIDLSLESFIAGIDQSVVTDTNAAPQAAAYDALRALEPADLEAALEAYWPTMATGIRVVSGDDALPLTYQSVDIPLAGNVEDLRTSTLVFSAALPSDATMVRVGWAPEFGTLVLRQMGVDNPYSGFLLGGSDSADIALSGGN